jgi:hypothetical protein
MSQVASATEHRVSIVKAEPVSTTVPLTLIAEVSDSPDRKVSLQQIITVSGTPVTDTHYDPPTHVVDNSNDHFGPFIHFVRYDDGVLNKMTQSAAIAYCKDARFVKQPAHRHIS